jgi:hypothetical protein
MNRSRHQTAVNSKNPPSSIGLQNALSRITALTRELYKDIEYASHAHCRNLWTAYQKRRSAQSIAKKKDECRRLIRSIGSKELLAITERLWAALWHEWPLDRPDPAPPILEWQKATIADLRLRVCTR